MDISTIEKAPLWIVLLSVLSVAMLVVIAVQLTIIGATLEQIADTLSK